MNKITKQNRNRLLDTENRLTAVRGREARGWVKQVKGLSKNKNKQTNKTHKQQGGDYERERW